MIALAFAAGRREREFETMLTRLRKTIEAEGYTFADNDIPRPLSRVRADQYRAGSMIRRETAIVGGVARSVVNFRVDSYRYQVISEAWRNYDVTFWNIIRTWLDAVITDCPGEESLDTHVAVAMGLATMAQVDLSEVWDSYLDRWASGSLGKHGQQVAIYVLWLMCFNDVLPRSRCALPSSGRQQEIRRAGGVPSPRSAATSACAIQQKPRTGSGV